MKPFEMTDIDDNGGKIYSCENGTMVKITGSFTQVANDQVQVFIHDDRESRQSVFWHGVGVGLCFGVAIMSVLAVLVKYGVI